MVLVISLVNRKNLLSVIFLGGLEEITDNTLDLHEQKL